MGHKKDAARPRGPHSRASVSSLALDCIFPRGAKIKGNVTCLGRESVREFDFDRRGGNGSCCG